MSHLIASVPGATFADGSVADVELWASSEPVADDAVFAAMVVVTDATGRYAAVYSPRRREWGIPGGWREPGESAVECAVREVWEETGLRLDPEGLRVFGHESFAPVSAHGRWPERGGSMQLFRCRVHVAGGELVAAEPDAVDPRWVTAQEFETLSGGQFWWPLVAAAMTPER
ncbi:NUDIX hydrolase [Pedococcus bigeumensis]|uniref:NUDIX hydrolase n=1 Tax=Pedococcus bigeumensis TaxID=433644 RepID=UPI002FE8031E